MMSQWSEVTICTGAHFSKCKIKDSPDKAAQVTVLKMHKICLGYVFHLGTPDVCLLLTEKCPNSYKRQSNFSCLVSALHRLEICC